MNEILTPEEFVEEMRKIYDKAFVGYDQEITHVEADGLMCDLLTALGYGDGAKIFEDMPKWYA